MDQSQLLEQHLKTVGVLVNLATLCDLVLFNAFKVISGCEPKIANAIYFSNESFKAKEAIVNRVLLANNDAKESEIVKAIIKANDKANKKRNNLSHALLQIEGGQLYSLNARQQEKSATALSPRVLDEMHKHASVAHLEAMRQYQALCQKRGIPAQVTHT
jgi:hypothetical protein